MIATILVIFIVGFIIVHHIYKLKDEINDIKEQINEISRYQTHYYEQIAQQLSQIDYAISDIVADITSLRCRNIENNKQFE